MTDDWRIVPCGCSSCPARDGNPEAYHGQTFCPGPWMVLQGYPARLLGCQFPSEEAAERWVRDQSDARLH